MQAFLNLLPSEVLWSRVCEAPVEFSSMPIGDRDGFRSGRDTIPNVLDQLEALLDRELLNLFEQGLGGHASNFGETETLRKRFA
jgi:hypothetical protein